jgi:hypothetical protein
MPELVTGLSLIVLMVVAVLIALAVDRWLVRPTVAQIVPLVPEMPPPAPPPVVAAPPPAPPPARPTRDPLTIHLISATGRSLGSTVIDRKARRPTLRFKPARAKVTATFVADKEVNGGFVYRQVGTERE